MSRRTQIRDVQPRFFESHFMFEGRLYALSRRSLDVGSDYFSLLEEKHVTQKQKALWFKKIWGNICLNLSFNLKGKISSLNLVYVCVR